jgi:hypothetical protein
MPQKQFDELVAEALSNKDLLGQRNGLAVGVNLVEQVQGRVARAFGFPVTERVQVFLQLGQHVFCG